MPKHKTYYRIAEAAERLGCQPGDVIGRAAQGELTLLVGIPDGIDLRTYDAEADLSAEPALLVPVLLALSESQCLKIELNGQTQQSDFRVGYVIGAEGRLQEVRPSYGRPRLNHGWAFWRTSRGSYPHAIDLTPERLFVLGESLEQVLADRLLPKPKKKAKEAVESVARDEASDAPNAESSASKAAPERLTLVTAAPAVVVVPAERPSSVHAPMTILRMPEVMKRTGLSRSTIYDKLDPKSPRYDETFPKRRTLGAGSVGWVETEIDAWLALRDVVSGRCS